MKKMMFAEAAIGLVATLIFELFPQPFVNIFGASGESVYYTEFAIKCIRLYLCTLTLSCVNKGSFHLFAVARQRRRFDIALAPARSRLRRRAGASSPRLVRT